MARLIIPSSFELHIFAWQRSRSWYKRVQLLDGVGAQERFGLPYPMREFAPSLSSYFGFLRYARVFLIWASVTSSTR